VIVFPNAKINVGLNVVERLPKGYHAIETIMIPIPLYDIIEVLPSQKVEWKQSGRQIKGIASDNLCIQALDMIAARYSIDKVYMHLHKRIPFGAGLGGGSADATFVIKALNELFALNLDINEQRNLASELGSDCAFFVENRPQLSTGRGEILRPIEIDLSGYTIVVIKPLISVNTAQAYANVYISGDRNRLHNDIQKPITEWKHCIKNDFEHSIFKRHPQLAQLKQDLYTQGAIYASMSGSGSAIFGIFQYPPQLSYRNCEVVECVL